MIDKGLVFCTAQALSATGNSTDAIPLTAARKIFQGEPLAAFVHVDVAADAASGDETYAFEVQTDDNAGQASPTQLVTRSISRTLLLINTNWSVPVPMESTLETFLGMKFTLGGTTPSITVTAWLGALKDTEMWTAYQDSITIA